MTRQIINIGTGPDSYTGDNLRTAFTKVNDNFAQLYAGNVRANTSVNILTANGVATNGNVNTGNVNVQYQIISSGNVSAPYFNGNGRNLTGVQVTANLGNLIIDGPTNQTITGTTTGSMALRPYLNSGLAMILESNVAGSFGNLFFGAFQNNLSTISTQQTNSNLQLSANSARIILNGQSNKIGFNTNPSTGYDFTFDGDISARSYYARESFPVGYSFTTPLGDTGFSHSYDTTQGNISLIKIRHDSNAVARFYENLTTILSGNLVVSQTGNIFGSFPNAFIQTYSNVNSYSQLVLQNKNNGALASTDLIVTAGNGNDSAFFGDFGIASNTYAYPGYGIIKPNDVYLIAVSDDITGPGSSDSGNLILGTTNGNIKFFIGPPEDANIAATINSTGVNIASTLGDFVFNQTGNLSMPMGGIIQVSGGIVAGPIIASPAPVISGFSSISAQRFTATGNVIVGNAYVPSTASSAGSAGQIAYDSNYVYVCVATNTWRRANLSTW